MSMPHTGSFTAVALFIVISPSFMNFGSMAAEMLIDRIQQLIMLGLLTR
jgi:hypothetical protein